MARLAEAPAAGGFVSARARAIPNRAGVHSSSISSAAMYDCDASAWSYFSPNRSPQRVWMAGSSGAAPAAFRSSALA